MYAIKISAVYHAGKVWVKDINYNKPILVKIVDIFKFSYYLCGDNILVQKNYREIQRNNTALTITVNLIKKLSLCYHFKNSYEKHKIINCFNTLRTFYGWKQNISTINKGVV